MSQAVLCLGSNLGDRLGLLRQAVDTLGPLVRAASSVYRTPPWGPVPQDDYYNLVLLVSDDDDDPGPLPLRWLHRCRQLEEQAGRVRGVRFGPRTLDADVIVVDDIVSADPELTLPHPRAHQRAFVLVPWAEVDPAGQLPGYGPIADLLAALPVTETDPIVRICAVD